MVDQVARPVVRAAGLLGPSGRISVVTKRLVGYDEELLARIASWSSGSSLPVISSPA
ncbi:MULTISPECIES: hypothetical protein [unclassified Streptomyces]|uniref:hypothetical protein n=1 Tax=unclassified Streptomyces TaxID=2593676 RepID=UPI002DDBE0F2|nr:MULTISPECIES: hypothetical protein [unclassified Streptomyces]WSD93469.1 hypothetical protein OG758_04270 [Streptomyces sp. NBC_01474]